MDEPLASLDEERKAEILPYIQRLRDETGIPIVYVSHSVSEVARLATTLIVLSNGRIATAGPTADVMARLNLSPSVDRLDAEALSAAAPGERAGPGRPSALLKGRMDPI